MNLPELITKLLLIERQLIEDGIDVNKVDVQVTHFNNESRTITTTLNDIAVYKNKSINLSSF